MKERDHVFYHSGPIFLNYLGFKIQDKPTRDDVCNRFTSLLNLIHICGIPSLDFKLSQFERAVELSIRDVEDKSLLLKVQKMN